MQLSTHLTVVRLLLVHGVGGLHYGRQALSTQLHLQHFTSSYGLYQSLPRFTSVTEK
jgi:hypothetical protein